MTRKDYITVAAGLRAAYQAIYDIPRPAHDQVQRCNALRGFRFAAEYIADSLAQDNPRFNRKHFLAVAFCEKELRSRPSRNGGAA